MSSLRCFLRTAINLSLLLSTGLLAFPVDGASRALLIGLSYEGAPYLGRQAALPGIDLDVAAMRQVAKDLGIVDVRVLWNSEATLEGVRSAIRDLGHGLKGDDLVLVYYTGHGAQTPDDSGDESDGKDEVLLPFDALPRGGRLTNVLTDEELGDLLRGIPSNRVLLIVDSCNSGTIARSFGPRPKSYYYSMAESKPNAGGDAGGMLNSASGSRDNFVGVMAAQDDEFAVATNEGSVLTSAILQTIHDAKALGTGSITIQGLFEGVHQRVASATSQMARRNPSISQHPSLFSNNPALASFDLPLASGTGTETSLAVANDPLIRYWREFAARANEEVPLRAARQVLQVHPAPSDPSKACGAEMRKHLLSIEVVVPRNGFLTLINAGEGEQQATVLFPNRYQPDSHVRKGQRVVIPPPDQDQWCLPADLPVGKDFQNALVVAIFGKQDINLYRDGQGSGAFRLVPDGARSFRVRAESGAEQADSYASASALFRIER